MSEFKDLKLDAFEANMELHNKGLVIHTFGNVSVFDREKGVFAIKPTGVKYSQLTPESMTIVDLKNNVVNGDLKPSSDTKTHSVLYNHFNSIKSVEHTHSSYAVAWAQAMKPIPVLGTTHADHLAHEIPCTDVLTDDMIQGDYEVETGNQIIKTFEKLSYEEIEMVLVACHGPFTWGENADKAVYNAVMLEEIAKIALLTLQVNSNVSEIKQSLIKKHYERKHGKVSYYGQNHEDKD
ncbi:L-ribulose-5-phosphate 4-epimerase AraD [Bacteroidota bacterium]